MPIWPAGAYRAVALGNYRTMLFNLIRRYAIMAVVIPLAAAGARKLSDTVEKRRGPSRGTRLLRKGADTLQGTFGRQKKKSRFAFGR